MMTAEPTDTKKQEIDYPALAKLNAILEALPDVAKLIGFVIWVFLVAMMVEVTVFDVANPMDSFGSFLMLFVVGAPALILVLSLLHVQQNGRMLEELNRRLKGVEQMLEEQNNDEDNHNQQDLVS